MRNALLTASIAIGPLASAQFVPNGPDAPEVSLMWNDGWSFTLENPLSSNNYAGGYMELIPELESTDDPFWRFQGYLIFQVVDTFNTYTDDAFDPALARLVGSSDLDDGITELTGVRHMQLLDEDGNTVFETCYYEHVIGADAGISFTYAVQEDAFTGAPLTETSNACYVAYAYASNPYMTSAACGGADELLLSKRASLGAMGLECVGEAYMGFADPGGTHISIGPNPCLGEFRLFGIPGSVDLTIAAQDGRVVLDHSQLQPSTMIQAKDLAPGAYVVRARTRSGEVSSARLLVSR